MSDEGSSSEGASYICINHRDDGTYDLLDESRPLSKAKRILRNEVFTPLTG